MKSWLRWSLVAIVLAGAAVSVRMAQTAFDASALAPTVVTVRPGVTPEVIRITCFSSDVRCTTCVRIEHMTREMVERNFAPELRSGRTLLLLDAIGAYHRESARQVGPSGMHFTTPMMQLQDSTRTKVLIVTLAETTPVPGAAVLLRRRAMAEREQIEAVADRYSNPFAVVPLPAEEPVGIERLLRLSAADESSPKAASNA